MGDGVEECVSLRSGDGGPSERTDNRVCLEGDFIVTNRPEKEPIRGFSGVN